MGPLLLKFINAEAALDEITSGFADLAQFCQTVNFWVERLYLTNG